MFALFVWHAMLFCVCGTVQTETAVRFSLVTHGRDCPEGLRDVRGFATKFYTSEGNWDLVGNNIPVSPLIITHHCQHVAMRDHCVTRGMCPVSIIYCVLLAFERLDTP